MNSAEFRFDGLTALVTGCSRKIGKDLAVDSGRLGR
jgi:hypothetical protein